LQPAGRSQALDVLRGLAILLVFGRHAQSLEIPFDRLPASLSAWSRIGWCGVDLFFVLSGFLIGRLLLREFHSKGTVSVGRFLIRRGFRIYPPFWLMLIASCVVWGGAQGAFTREAVWGEVLFVQDYVAPEWRIWDHTWSLAVEEQFYLVLPIALWLISKLARAGRAARLAGITAAVIVVAALVARLAVSRTEFALHTHVFPAHLRMDALAIGVVLAAVELRAGEQLRRWIREHRLSLVLTVAFGAAWIWHYPLEAPAMTGPGFSIVAVACAALLCLALDWKPGLRWTPLAVVGRASYSLYLFHLPVRLGLRNAGIVAGESWQSFAVFLGLALAVGLSLHVTLERACLSLRDCYFPGADHRSPVVGTSSARSPIVQPEPGSP
jgi:peptidoglycan/LPS O-acetylase OafA/YrhL